MEYGPAYGARILDRYMPDWYLKIDVELLDMTHSQFCIAGQSFEGKGEWSGYSWFVQREPRYDHNQEYRLGFDCDVSKQSWVDLIKKRINQV